MTKTRPHVHETAQLAIYQIRIEGELDQRWASWFGDLEIAQESAHPVITCLSGAIVDQASLRGILNRIWDLNLALISVQRVVQSGPEDRPEDQSEDRSGDR
jgi:hypothetical protein